MAQQMINEERNKAIDEFVQIFKSRTRMENKLVDEIAEELKAERVSKENELLTRLTEFFFEHAVECEEDIYQSEFIEEDSLELIEDLFSIVKSKNRTCNCQRNSNSRENESCCRCDSRTANINKVRVNSLEIIARMIHNKPYYELKYREIGKKDYSIGYSSYDLKIVLGYIDTYFEIVENDRQTNADRIRNMSDEELLDFICSIETYGEGSVMAIKGGTAMCSVTEVEEWLQSEAEQERTKICIVTEHANI